MMFPKRQKPKLKDWRKIDRQEKKAQAAKADCDHDQTGQQNYPKGNTHA